MPLLARMVVRPRQAFAALHSCAAAVSLSADVTARGALKPAPLLRQMDSALWRSGLGSHLVDAAGGADGGGDTFCVTQALDLAPRARERAGVPHVLDLFGRAGARVEDPALRVFTWITAVGGSSVDLGVAIARDGDGGDDDVFATARRKFVRVGPAGRPAAWTSAQRAVLEAARAADADAAVILLRGGGRCGVPARLPSLARLGAPPSPPSRDDGTAVPPLLRTVALPHMMGAGGHLDHAALLELGYDAHVLRGGGGAAREESAAPLELRISYVGQGGLGDALEVIEYGGDDAGAGAGLLLVRRADDGAVLAVMSAAATTPPFGLSQSARRVSPCK